jgi:ribosomal protein S20
VANAIKKGDLELAKKELNLFASVADKAGKKNVIHKNKASRLKGRLAKSINVAAAAKA